MKTFGVGIGFDIDCDTDTDPDTDPEVQGRMSEVGIFGTAVACLIDRAALDSACPQAKAKSWPVVT